MVKDFDLDGRVAIVTGAGRGIGKAISLVLAEAGAALAVVARSENEIKETVKDVQERGGKGIAIPCDVTKAKEVDNMVEKTVSEYGRIDILVNQAGAGIRKPLVPLPNFRPKWGENEPVKDFYTPTSNEEWQYMLDANCTSIFLCTRAVGPHMIRQKKGKIINITSVGAAKGFQYHSQYNSAKAAANMFTRSMALEWARYNINVNAIGPGYVLTAFTERIFENEEVKRQTLRSIPLRRFCDPREVGLLVLYLASDSADYITGQVIYIDGGILA